MEGEEPKTSKDCSKLLADLLSRRSKVQEELREIEKQVYDMETNYLLDPSQCGNVFQGFERFLSASKNTTFLKRSRKLQPGDRLFSLSSVTSPAAEEIASRRDEEDQRREDQQRQEKQTKADIPGEQTFDDDDPDFTS